MAKITIVDAGVDSSTFTPTSNVNLPGSLTLMSAVAADVIPDVASPAVGLKVTKVQLDVTALGNSGGTPSGEFVVYDDGTQLFTTTFGSGGGTTAQTTSITVNNSVTRAFTVKWRAVNGGTYLPSGQSVVLTLTSEDWEG